MKLIKYLINRFFARTFDFSVELKNAALDAKKIENIFKKEFSDIIKRKENGYCK